VENMGFSTILKIIGAFSTGTGSILLAWRVKVLLEWITYAIIAHETSIIQLIKILGGQPQTHPTITGTPVHLLKIQDKLGLYLLIGGFMLLGLGMLANGISYFL
jgi:hypothetical protein